MTIRVPDGWVEVPMEELKKYLANATFVYTRLALCGGFEYYDYRGDMFAIVVAESLENIDKGTAYTQGITHRDKTT